MEFHCCAHNFGPVHMLSGEHVQRCNKGRIKFRDIKKGAKRWFWYFSQFHWSKRYFWHNFWQKILLTSHWSKAEKDRNIDPLAECLRTTFRNTMHVNISVFCPMQRRRWWKESLVNGCVHMLFIIRLHWGPNPLYTISRISNHEDFYRTK